MAGANIRKWEPAVLVAGAVAASLWARGRLPERVEVRFEGLLPFAGTAPPETAARGLVLWLMPALALLAFALFRLAATSGAQGFGRRLFRHAPANVTSPAQFERFGGTYDVIVFAVAMLFVGAHAAMLAAALQAPALAVRILPAVLGVCLVLMGNVMPRLRPNWVAGLRSRRLLEDPQLWRSTHRVFGAAFVVSGLVTIGAAVAAPAYGVIVAVVSILVSCLIGWLASMRVGGTGGRTSLASLLLVCASAGDISGQAPAAPPAPVAPDDVVESPFTFVRDGFGVGAVAPERATFLLLVNADTMVIEHATRTASRLSGEIVIRGQGMRFVYQAELSLDAGIPALENAMYHGADTVPRQHSQVRIVGDTAFARSGSAVQAFPTTVGALPMVTNLSTAFLEQLVLVARARGGAEQRIPTFLILNGMTMPVTVRLLPGAGGRGVDSATVQMPGLVIRLALRADGRILGGTVPSQRARIVRLDTHSTLAPDQPDYSAPPGAPYTTEDVHLTTPGGIRLAGTLTLPVGAPGARYPAVVTITGSGAQTRDGMSIGLSGYKPYRQLADTLGRRGIAVLRLDDRGAGASDAGPPTATTADFADDIHAALAFLRTHPRIDGARLALVGHSEGAIIAPLIAAEDRALRALVLLAGPGQPGREVLRYQQRYAVDSIAKLTGASRDAAIASAQASTDSLAAALPWFRFFLEHDPAVPARQVRAPVLILHGEMDHQVPVNEAMLLARAIRAGSNEAVTVRTFPELNHLFVPHGGPGFDYSRLPSLVVQPEVLGAMTDWLLLTLR